MSLVAENIYRQVADEVITENQNLLIDIPRVHDINSIMIHLTGVITVGAAVAAAVAAESPAGMIQRVNLTANGRDVLHQSTGEFACFGNYQRQFRSVATPPQTAIAAYNVEAVFTLDRINADGPRPKDSAFQAYLTSLFQLTINTGAVTDAITAGGGGTVAWTAGRARVFVDSVVEKDGDKGEAKAVKKITMQENQYAAANGNSRFQLPTGNALRCVTIHATDDGEPSDVLVNTAELAIDNIDTRQLGTWDALRFKNSQDKNVAMPAGYAVIDSDNMGKMTNLVDVSKASVAELVVDVNAPVGALGRVEVFTEEFILPRT